MSPRTKTVLVLLLGYALPIPWTFIYPMLMTDEMQLAMGSASYLFYFLPSVLLFLWHFRGKARVFSILSLPFVFLAETLTLYAFQQG